MFLHCHITALHAYITLQVYLILDEFILGGEFEETSKKVWVGGWGLAVGVAGWLAGGSADA